MKADKFVMIDIRHAKRNFYIRRGYGLTIKTSYSILE